MNAQKILNDLRPIFASVCTDVESELIEFEGENNHRRLPMNDPPKVAVSKLVNNLKGISMMLADAALVML